MTFIIFGVVQLMELTRKVFQMTHHQIILHPVSKELFAVQIVELMNGKSKLKTREELLPKENTNVSVAIKNFLS